MFDKYAFIKSIISGNNKNTAYGLIFTDFNA